MVLLEQYPPSCHQAAPIGIIGVLPMLAFGIWLAATGRLKPGIGRDVRVMDTRAS